MRPAFGVLVSLLILLSASAALAHHAFTAEYDANQVRSFTGTVTNVEWTNPHAHIYLDVADNQGSVTSWNFELGTPVMLRRLGWRSDSLKAGDEVTIRGYLARDGSNRANASQVTLPDGQGVFDAASSARTGPGQ